MSATSDWARAQGFTERLVDAGGAKLHTVAGGAGEPLLLLPGWPQSVYAWRKVMPELARHYRVVAVDPPGLGQSGPPVGGSDLGNVAGHIDALRAALGIERLHLVTHDIGTWIGYAYAARYPERVRRLVLSDAAIPGIASAEAYALTPERIFKSWHFYFNYLPDLPEGLIAGREAFYLAWLFRSKSADPATFGEADVAEYARIYAAEGAMTAGFGYYRAIFESGAQNRETAQRKLAMPVLAIGGETGVGSLMGQMAEAVAADVRREVVPNCGHYIPEEAPETFCRLVLPFLAEG